MNATPVKLLLQGKAAPKYCRNSFDKAKNGQETNFTDLYFLKKFVFKHIVVRFNRWFKKKDTW